MSLLGRALLLWCMASCALAEPVPVRVGGYVFPPFVQVSSDGEWSGVTLDVVSELNAMQSAYRFEFVPTAAARRYGELEAGHYDMLFFENPAWGWQSEDIQSLEGAVLGRALFIARAVDGRGQEYFDVRQDKRIALFSGYHYAFAGFIADPAHLRDAHNAVLTFSQESNIQMVLRRRVDLAVVTESFLEAYLSRHPQYRSRLLVADEADQYYQHFLVMRSGAEPGLERMKAYLDRLQDSGVLARILERNGINQAQP
ncbi:transporter substrate-binding domain-containing protein [Halopseudomonas nanhaiensis]|uniref:substrate-binding periplasmic protein n=1 Tax=Halopseudomonas nanhaiensis TaxID=2830842 RepID=UPI001CC0C355|nr:PhnD/SsuA/transferrin family substrate-binding protein [Halopseudomonas nanhaiensis]UAW97119.1 transporter substrate-binding domain-containing protein [Halopseudomonas nanhaiensis]